MAGTPTRLRLGLTVATDGTGAGSQALSLHQSLWVIAYLVISGPSGAPAWTLTVGGSIVATSTGSSALLGPIVVPPAAQVTVATTTGSPSTTYRDRKSTRLNSSHANISYAVFCLKKKKTKQGPTPRPTAC